MATLVIKKQLCAQFRRKKLLILAFVIIVFAFGAFKVSKKFRHLHREIRDMQSQDYISDHRFEAYKNIMERRMIHLEAKLSELTNRSPSQGKLDELVEIVKKQKEEISVLKMRVDIQADTLGRQDSQISSLRTQKNQAQTPDTIEVLKAQVKMLSNTVHQMKAENDALKRDYEKRLGSVSGLEQDFKTSTEKRLSELVNADYEHEQTFKDVKKAVEACAKQASMIALEAYIDDKLGTATKSSHQGAQASGYDQNDIRKLRHEVSKMNYQNDEMKVAVTKLEYDQKMNNQRVTSLETKQQEDDMIKKTILDANAVFEKFLEDPFALRKPELLTNYLNSLRKNNHHGRRMNGEPGAHRGFGRHHQRNVNMEPVKTFEKAASQNERVNSMNYNNFASKTPEELIAMMDQLLAGN